MQVHYLKTHTRYFDEIDEVGKNFEVRNNDRGFESGDYVILADFDPDTQVYSGRAKVAQISYVLRNYPAIQNDYVVFGIIDIRKSTRTVEENITFDIFKSLMKEVLEFRKGKEWDDENWNESYSHYKQTLAEFWSIRFKLTISDKELVRHWATDFYQDANQETHDYWVKKQ